MQSTLIPLSLNVSVEQKELVLAGGMLTESLYVPDVGRLIESDHGPSTLVGLFRLVSNNGKKLLLTANLSFHPNDGGFVMEVTSIREHMSKKVLAGKHFDERVRGEA